MARPTARHWAAVPRIRTTCQTGTVNPRPTEEDAMTDVTTGPPVSTAEPTTRRQFMTNVYAHVVGGIGAFIGFEYLLFTSGIAAEIYGFVVGTNWLLILGGFMIVSWMATHLAARATTAPKAYGGYGLLVAANGLLFATPLYQAEQLAPGAITTAAWLSIGAFVALSLVAITTSKDRKSTRLNSSHVAISYAV